MATAVAVDQTKLMEFISRFAVDLGAALHTPLILIGEELGLYKAMAESGAVTPGELARRTGTDERYLREWLCAHAAGGYVNYDPEGRARAQQAHPDGSAAARASLRDIRT